MVVLGFSIYICVVKVWQTGATTNGDERLVSIINNFHVDCYHFEFLVKKLFQDF